MLEDTSNGCKQVTLEESVTCEENDENEIEEIEVKQELMYSCSKCDFDTESEDNLNSHIKEHTQCSCSFTEDEDNVLKVHNSDCKIVPNNQSNTVEIEKKKNCLSTNLEPKESIIICGTCTKGFVEMKQFDQHMIEYHRKTSNLSVMQFLEKLGMNKSKRNRIMHVAHKSLSMNVRDVNEHLELRIYWRYTQKNRVMR